MKSRLTGLRPFILATFFVLSTGALARTSGEVSSQVDMRLWSFGNCERNFPSADSAEYQECMRVVGSVEAKDLRAQRSCEDSYASDQAGIDRCLSGYHRTKEGSTPAIAATTLSPEMTLKVQAIASAAVEQTSTVATESVSAAATTSRNAPSLMSRIVVGVLAILLLGVGGAFVLRRQV